MMEVWYMCLHFGGHIGMCRYFQSYVVALECYSVPFSIAFLVYVEASSFILTLGFLIQFVQFVLKQIPHNCLAYDFFTEPSSIGQQLIFNYITQNLLIITKLYGLQILLRAHVFSIIFFIV